MILRMAPAPDLPKKYDTNLRSSSARICLYIFQTSMIPLGILLAFVHMPAAWKWRFNV
jgi:hypothetical protein